MALMNVNGVEINTVEKGEGEAVVFLHGFTGSHADWLGQVEQTAVQYRTIAVDHRGHGQSSAPESESAYAIKTFADDRP